MRKEFITLLSAWIVGSILLWAAPPSSEDEWLKYEIYGLDVSKHTHTVDWLVAKDHDIRFVYLKATEGATYVDPKYKEFYQQAKEAELPVGVYHFFRFETPALKQFENFVEHVDLTDNDLIPVLDIEESGKTNRRRSAKQVVPEIKKFLAAFEKKYGFKMILYTNETCYNRYLKEGFEDYPLWITSFRYMPTIKRPWLFWQFSWMARIEGTKHPVDLNVFYGDEKSWLTYLNESKQTLKSLKKTK